MVKFAYKDLISGLWVMSDQKTTDGKYSVEPFVIVQWDEPANGGSIITDYIKEVRVAGG